MTQFPDSILMPDRKAELFRNAVLARLGSLVKDETIGGDEEAYLSLIDDAIRATVDAVVETLDRVAPRD